MQRLDALFDIERGINGKSPAERLATGQELSPQLMADLFTWLTEQVAKLLRGPDLTKACFFMLTPWDAFTCFLADLDLPRQQRQLFPRAAQNGSGYDAGEMVSGPRQRVSQFVHSPCHRHRDYAREPWHHKRLGHPADARFLSR